MTQYLTIFLRCEKDALRMLCAKLYVLFILYDILIYLYLTFKVKQVSMLTLCIIFIIIIHFVIY